MSQTSADLLGPIHTTNVSKATIDRLLALIRDGYWKAGDQLPPQRQLARSFGIGMSTLREALQSLQSYGILEMRQGEGTFVSAQPYQTIERILGMSLALGDLDLQSLFDARIVLEAGLAQNAATRAADEQVVLLFQNLDEQEAAIRDGRMQDVDGLDLEFHRMVAEMSGNKFLEQVADMLTLGLEQFLRSVPHTLEGLKLHRAVAEAIRSHDPERSSEASRRLVESTKARFNLYLHNSGDAATASMPMKLAS